MNNVFLKLTETPCPLLFMCPLFQLLISLISSDIGMGKATSQYRSRMHTTKMDSITFVNVLKALVLLQISELWLYG